MVDKSGEEKTSSYLPGERLEDLLSEHKSFLDGYKDIIDNVAQGLATASPGFLELVSTSDYANRWLRTELGRAPQEAEVVRRVGELKKGKFTEKPRSVAYHWLQKVGLVDD